jgi:hypothetical protein
MHRYQDHHDDPNRGRVRGAESEISDEARREGNKRFGFTVVGQAAAAGFVQVHGSWAYRDP